MNGANDRLKHLRWGISLTPIVHDQLSASRIIAFVLALVAGALLSLALGFAWLGDSNVKAALLTSVTTVVTAGVSVLLIVWQIGAQARQGRKQATHGEILKLKLDAYRELLKTQEEAVDALVQLSTGIRVLYVALATAETAVARGAPPMIPVMRTPRLIQLQLDAETKTAQFVNFIESWEIMVPGIDVFQIAFTSALHDMRVANAAHINAIMFLLPIEVPHNQGGGIRPWTPPDPITVYNLQKLAEFCYSSISDLQSYADDFRREMQRHFLYEMFPNPVQSRKPLDPRSKVISIARHDELIRYFNEQTPWGRHCAEVNEQVRKTIRERGEEPLA